MGQITSLGIVKHGDEVLLENVLFHINVTQGSSQRLGTWIGTFDIPDSPTEQVIAFHNARGPLTLVLEDGQQGEFVCTNVRGIGVGATVNFQGSGALK